MNTNSILRSIRESLDACIVVTNVKRPVQVLLLEMPQLLREIVEHSIHVVGGCEVMPDTTLRCENSPAATPDVVVLGLAHASDATLVPALFARWPEARILTIATDGSDAATYELTLNRRVLGSLGAVQLADVLRSAPLRNRQHGDQNQ